MIRFICDDCVNQIYNVDSVMNDIKKIISENNKGLEQVKDDFAASLKQNREDIQAVIKEIENKLKNQIVNNASERENQLKESVTSIKDSVNKLAVEMKKKNNSVDSMVEKKTYASELKKNSQIKVVPKEVNQTAEKTKSEIKARVNPSTSGIQVSGIQKLNSGAIIVSCDNENSIEKLTSDVKNNLGDDYSVDVINRNPRIKISYISDRFEENDLISCIRKQNDFLKNSELKFKTMWKRKGKRSDYYTAIIEMDVNSYNEIMKVGKISVGWDKCEVSEAIYVKRCYKCLGFGHFSKDCTSDRMTCLKCGGQHKGSECTAECLSCVNCVKMNEELKLNLDVNHNALDNCCEVYLRRLKTERKRHL
ncbi:uncharacterized protein LOC129906442 [Episyrphus balteatus]|uniref:uncharacterized protein LOC129906442 n=1 Tax=Episyrphus balteatus TaxID=286459 RepID=UPI0024856F5C|nr:uncharacterized protein LOC129906442 [Episyrphus balteatus]